MATLFRNGRIYTPGTPDASALVIADGTIVWIGTEDGIGQHAGTEVVDLDGALVTPAFVDAHVHTTSTGLGIVGLSLASARSLSEALDRIEVASRANRGRPLLGGEWDETDWPERRPPTSAELDRAAYGGSVYLARVDVHSAVVSSSLAAATPGLAGLAGYRADGWMSRAAHDAVRTAAQAALTASQIREAQLAALHAAAALGIACVHEMGGPAISSEADFTALLQVAEQEAVPEVIGYWGELGAVEKARELGAVGAAGDLFCDGSLGSHTAALSEPYADLPESSGMLRFDTVEIADHVLACNSAGLQAGFHAIGDAAIDQLLDALDVVAERIGRAGGAGHRIEHAEYVRAPARLAASGLIASMQPLFDALWGGESGMYAQRLGRRRALDLNRFGDLAAAGVPLAFGSDAPVTPLGPWAAIRAAAYPHDTSAAVSPRAALASHTRAGWRAAGRDGEGVLQPGAPATLAVWEAGELAVDAPDERVSRWSTDPRAAVPGLPDLAPGRSLPECVATYLRGAPIFTRT